MTAFVLAALVLIMMPGPDQVLVTRNALVGGRRGGLATVAGGALGLTVHATAAAIGLSALLLASATAFLVLKVVGCVYLAWMAVQTLRASRHPADTTASDAGRTAAPATCLRQGFLSNALNPKVALFFVTFLPQFLPSATTSPAADSLVLSGVFAVLYVAWFGLYAVLVEGLGRWLRRPKVATAIERVTGVLLLGVATRLAVAQV